MNNIKGARVSPNTTKQIMSQLNKNKVVNSKLKIELEQLIRVLNKDNM